MTVPLSKGHGGDHLNIYIYIYVENDTELYKNTKTSVYNTKDIKDTQIHFEKAFFVFRKTFVFKDYTFILISGFRLLLWPASGGPKNLVYIYTYI